MADRNDFEEFVAARSAALLRTAYLLTGQHADAEDLLQRAFLKVVPAWSRIQGSPEAYVRKVMVRENISRWRARRWREVLVSRHPEEPTDSGTSLEDRLTLMAALATLAPRQRAVIVLRYFEDLTEVETARLLGVAVGTVKSQHRDAIARLRVLVPDLLREGSDERRTVAP
ncbi:SigE family RNA polymerase sigma factor [Nocardioides marmoriginsengisoli]|uniref:SigE family RNA polymerase sigma factor n=1 Tax=Nocardioides marmoriginsengisoli TaxID=661483 RepID=UPI001FE7B9AE|nr:SigE family RNA polymerase sigma factor [Nocardioides marmoriginsengisoli]